MRSTSVLILFMVKITHLIQVKITSGYLVQDLLNHYTDIIMIINLPDFILHIVYRNILGLRSFKRRSTWLGV